MSIICPYNSKEMWESGDGFHFDMLTILGYLSTIAEYEWIYYLIRSRVAVETELEMDSALSIHIDKTTHEIKVNCDLEYRFPLIIEKVKFRCQREEIIRAIKLRFAPPLRKAVLYSYK